MAKNEDVIRPLNEGVHQRGGQRPKPKTPRPEANPVGQRPDSGKPTGTDTETKE